MKTLDIDQPINTVPFTYQPDETNALKECNFESISMDEIRRIALWKINRTIDVPKDVLEKLQNLKKDKKLKAANINSREAILALVKCKGIHYPMASAILKFLRPDIYPIIDVRAYRVLEGKKIRTDQYTIDIYLSYIEKINKIASVNNLKIAAVDEQLYELDKILNGNIN